MIFNTMIAGAGGASQTYSITCSNCTAWAHAEGTEGGYDYVVSDEISEASAGSTVYVFVPIDGGRQKLPNSDNNVELTLRGYTNASSYYESAPVYSFTMPENDAIVGFHDR